MSGVFLSYRRDDTADDAKRIYDRLVAQFGADLVFLDIKNIPLGVDFAKCITDALDTAAYVLIAIGPRWLLLTDETGRNRLDDHEDLVRYEVRIALENKLLVVPMLVGGAKMPRKQDLPKEIAPLVRRNGMAIRPDPDFEADVEVLMSGLHLDRIDKTRVPMIFHVGLLARDLGIGGATGWGLLGLALGIVSLAQRGLAGLIALPLSGVLAGLTGGALVGWLTGLLIRHKAPPLVSSDVRRMGITWSLSIVVSVVLAGVAGYFLGIDTSQDLVDNAESFGSAIVAAFVGIFIVIALVSILIVLGLMVGSGVAATYFARKLRLRSEEISRSRGIAIGLVWLLGGLFSGAVFVMLMSLLTN